MRRIAIQNPILSKTYVGDVAVDYTAAGLSLTLRSNNSFAANDLAVVGNPTEELTEVKKIDSISGNTVLTLAAGGLKFSHNKGTPVYKTLWDYVSIDANYGAGFTTITQSAIQWDSKTNETLYFDANGTDSTIYRFRFYNAVSLTFSEYSSSLTGTGFTKFQMGYIIKQARRVAGDRDGKIMDIPDLLRAATRAKNIIRAHNPRYWFWKVNGYNSNVSITAVAAQSVYSLSSISDFGTTDLIEYRYVLGSTDMRWLLKRKADAEFMQYTRNAMRPSVDFPHYFRLLPPDSNSAKGYFEIENKIKSDSIGTFYVDYYKEEADYNSVDDATAIIMPEILEDYLTAVIYETKNNDAMAQKYYDRFAGPEQREKTLALKSLTGIALLDELDKQSKTAQGQPTQLWRYRGQRAMTNLYGNRQVNDPDYIRENYFDGPE